jgi:hypothetical protein
MKRDGADAAFVIAPRAARRPPHRVHFRSLNLTVPLRDPSREFAGEKCS